MLKHELQQIVMLQGMGINERVWARLVSRFGRVTLIQQGMIQHTEVWEQGVCRFYGPEISVVSTRKWDEATLSALTLRRSLARVREQLHGQPADVIIASNYSMGLAALWLRWRGEAKRVIVFVTDFLPLRGSLAVRIHRWITTRLNRFACRHADEVWSLSPRIPFMQANPKSFVVPIAMEDQPVPAGDREEIGYIGYPTADHALEILFEICRKHHFRLNIIGNSPYLDSIKHLAPVDTVFHGMISDTAKINQIIARCFCGYAVYRNTGPMGYSYYGFPSKTFAYFASHTPFVTTMTAHFSPEFEQRGIACVVEPRSDQIEAAILRMRANFPQYREAIARFLVTWNEAVLRFHQERLAANGVGVETGASPGS
jgi:hypothetical protein